MFSGFSVQAEQRGWFGKVSFQPFILGNILLGTIAVFAHEAGTDPFTTIWFRCAFGLLALTGWIAWRRQLSLLMLSRGIRLKVAAIGLLMLASWYTFFAAIENISAGVATVLFHIQPLWVLLLSALWLKATIEKPQIVSVLVALIGLALATGFEKQLSEIVFDTGNLETGKTVSLSSEYWLSVSLCIAGSVCMACVTLIAKQLRDVAAGVLAWWQCAIGSVLLLIWPLVNGWPDWGYSWLWLSGLGLIHTGVAYSLIYMGMAKLSLERITVLQFIYPGIVILLDWLVYQQRLDSMQILGVTLMVLAIGFTEYREARQ